jgi:hypothetical protein
VRHDASQELDALEEAVGGTESATEEFCFASLSSPLPSTPRASAVVEEEPQPSPDTPKLLLAGGRGVAAFASPPRSATPLELAEPAAKPAVAELPAEPAAPPIEPHQQALSPATAPFESSAVPATVEPPPAASTLAATPPPPKPVAAPKLRAARRKPAPAPETDENRSLDLYDDSSLSGLLASGGGDGFRSGGRAVQNSPPPAKAVPPPPLAEPEKVETNEKLPDVPRRTLGPARRVSLPPSPPPAPAAPPSPVVAAPPGWVDPYSDEALTALMAQEEAAFKGGRRAVVNSPVSGAGGAQAARAHSPAVRKKKTAAEKHCELWGAS